LTCTGLHHLSDIWHSLRHQRVTASRSAFLMLRHRGIEYCGPEHEYNCSKALCPIRVSDAYILIKSVMAATPRRRRPNCIYRIALLPSSLSGVMSLACMFKCRASSRTRIDDVAAILKIDLGNDRLYPRMDRPNSPRSADHLTRTSNPESRNFWKIASAISSAPDSTDCCWLTKPRRISPCRSLATAP
jgi:hypothetical protein